MDKQGAAIFELLGKRPKSLVPVKTLAAGLGADISRAHNLVKALQREGYIEMLGSWCSLSPKGIQYIEKFAEREGTLRTTHLKEQQNKEWIDEIAYKPLEELFHVSEVAAFQLKGFNLQTVGDVARAPLLRVMENTGLSFREAVKIINEARMRLGWHKVRE